MMMMTMIMIMVSNVIPNVVVVVAVVDNDNASDVFVLLLNFNEFFS